MGAHTTKSRASLLPSSKQPSRTSYVTDPNRPGLWVDPDSITTAPAPAPQTAPSEPPPPYTAPPTGNSAAPLQHDFQASSTTEDPHKTKSMTVKEYFRSIRFSHIWFLVFNIAAIVLSLCVLSGGKSSPQYSLINIPASELAYALGATSSNFTSSSSLPDSYALGVSGVCRIIDKVPTCNPRFPSTFNLASIFFHDMFSFSDPAAEASAYSSFVAGSNIQHETVGQLSTALGALLLVSVVLSFLLIPAVMTRRNGFSSTLIVPLVFDSLLLLACCTLMVSIYALEIWGLRSYGSSFSGSPGLGFWILIAAFVCRLLANPAVFIGYLVVWFMVAFCPISCCVAAICCGSSGGSGSTSNTSYDGGESQMVRYTEPVSEQYAVAVVDKEMAYVETDRKGNTTLLWMKERYTVLVNL